MDILGGWGSLVLIVEIPVDIQCKLPWDQSLALRAELLSLHHEGALHLESISNSLMLTLKAESTVRVGKGTPNLCFN